MTESSMYSHEIEKSGFKIRFDALMADDGEIDPRSECTPEEYADIIRKMDNFELRHFTAKVTASKCGVLLADAYLGGCLYSQYEDFHSTECGYWDDMVASVIKDAEAMIKRLAA